MTVDIGPEPALVNHAHPLFEPIWQAIKNWDIGRDGNRLGYAGATGNDVQTILDAIDAAFREENRSNG